MGSHKHHSEDSSSSHKHEGKRSHELLAGAAAFAAMRAINNHQEAQGKEVNHKLAKELLVAFAAAGAEKLIETKGRDKWDEYRSRSKSREGARERGSDVYEEEVYEAGYPVEEVVYEKRHRHREIEGPRGHSHSRERKRREEKYYA